MKTHIEELAAQTLSQLVDFIPHIERICTEADLTTKDSFKPALTKLLEALTLFIDAVDYSKKSLKHADAAQIQEVKLHEAELVSVLEDLEKYYREDHMEYVRELVQVHLTANLQDWKEKAIPLLTANVPA